MLRWEAIQRVEEAAFRAVAERLVVPLDSAVPSGTGSRAEWAVGRLGGRVAAVFGEGRVEDLRADELRLAMCIIRAAATLFLAGAQRAKERIAGGAMKCLSPKIREEFIILLAFFHWRGMRWVEAEREIARIHSGAAPWNLDGAMLWGRIGRGTGRANEAISITAEQLPLARALLDRRREAGLLRELALVCARTGDSDTGRRAYVAAAVLARAAGDAAACAVAWSNLGLLYQETGEYTRSLGCYRSGLRLHAQVGNRSSQASCLLNLGILQFEMGNQSHARASLERAEVMAVEVGNGAAEARALGHLAHLELVTAMPASAARRYEKALALHRARKDRAGEAATLLGLAGLQLMVGDYLQACEANRTAREIFRDLGYIRNEGIASVGLGGILMEMGELDQAAPILQKGRRLLSQAGDTVYEVQALALLARVELERRGQDATPIIEMALEKVVASGARYVEAHVRQVRGDVAAMRSDWAAAQSDARLSLALFEAAGTSGSVSSARWSLGLILAKAGAGEEARRVLNQGLDEHERYAREFGPDVGRAHVLAGASRAFEAAIGLELSEGTPEGLAAAFDLAERMRGRALLERIRGRDRTPATPEEFRSRRRDIEARLAHLEGARAMEMERPTPRPDLLEDFAARLRATRREHDRLLDELALRWPVYASAEGLTPPLSLAEVQAHVVGKPGHALLAYLVTEDELLLWVVRSDDVWLSRLPVGEEALRGAVDRVTALFCRDEAISPMQLLALSPRALRELTRDLLDPALPRLEGVERLLIVPSGPLHGLPFEMLVLRAPGEAGRPSPGRSPFAACEFVADRFEVAYGTSATLLDPRINRVHRPAGDPVAVLGLGDPSDGADVRIESSARELAVLCRLHRGAGPRAFVGSEASPAVYRQHAGAADLIHLGAHGQLDLESPQHTGVLLARDPQGDEGGLLQAYEIAEIRLERHPLVVLASCRVAHGPLCAGEGLLSLPRAFLQAGASAVVASLWPVEDRATALLFALFYRALAHGPRDPVSALARARRTVLRHSRRRIVDPRNQLIAGHPFFWAGFRIHGAPVAAPGRGASGAALHPAT